jgi:hypothetical protein
MALCTVCKALPFADILQNPEPDSSHIKTYCPGNDTSKSHHATLEALTLAANEGCSLCSRVLERLPFKGDRLHFPLRIYAIERQRQDLAARARCPGAETAADGSAAVGTPGIEFAETYRWERDRYHWTLPFYVAPVAGPPSPLITRNVPWPTVEDAAKDWLRFCGEKHPRCLPLSDGGDSYLKPFLDPRILSSSLSDTFSGAFAILVSDRMLKRHKSSIKGSLKYSKTTYM